MILPPTRSTLFPYSTLCRSLAAIREGNQQLLALRPRFELRVAQVLVAGDLALLLSPWSMTGTRPDGAVLELRGITSDVVRRQPDGAWQFIIDNPMGSGAVAETPQG